MKKRLGPPLQTIGLMNGGQFAEKFARGQIGMTDRQAKANAKALKRDLIATVSELETEITHKGIKVRIRNGRITTENTRLKGKPRSYDLPVKDYFANRNAVKLPERFAVMRAIRSAGSNASAKYGALIALEYMVAMMDELSRPPNTANASGP